MTQTQTTPRQNISELNNQSLLIAEELGKLKNESNQQAMRRYFKIKNQIRALENDVEGYIAGINGVEEDGTANQEQVEVLLESIAEYQGSLEALSSSISLENNAENMVTSVESVATVVSDESNIQDNEGMSAREYIKWQWDKVTDVNEWREKPMDNVVRIVTGVGVTGLVVEGAKKVFNKVKGRFGFGDDESEKEEAENKKTKWWKKPLQWLGIAAATSASLFAGTHLIDLLKKKFPELFPGEEILEDSFMEVQADLQNISETCMASGANMKREKIDDTSLHLTSYGQSIVIDYKHKNIPGMNVEFSTYSEVIHAANLVNFCAGSFRGRCASSVPFDVSDYGGGDMVVDLLDEGREEFMSAQGAPVGKVVGGLAAAAALYFIPGSSKLGVKGGLATILAGIVGGHILGDNNSTLQAICKPIAHGVGKKSFLAYLNRLPIRTQGHQEEHQVTESELKPLIVDIISEFRDDDSSALDDFSDHGQARQLDAVPDPHDPTKYTITSWGIHGKTIIFVNEANKTVTIEGFSCIFPLKEGLLVANLTNKIKHHYASKCDSPKPFSFKDKWITLNHPGMYVDNGFIGDRVLSEAMMQKKFPTLFVQKEKYIEFLNGLRDSHNTSLWTN